MIDLLTLETGADVGFRAGRLIIHQPSVFNIGFVGEEKFFNAVQTLTFNKTMLKNLDNLDLTKYSNFDILMSMIKNSYEEKEEQVENLYLLFDLLFPQQEIKIENSIIRIGEGFLDNSNFEEFQQYIKQIFCIGTKNGGEYNPVEGEMSARILKKLNDRKMKLAELKAEEESDGSLFGKIVDILSVGERKSKIELLKYTVYQLQEEYERFNLKEYYDFYNRARLVGAKDLKEPEDWMKTIRP